MISDKRSVQDLIAILKAHGIRHVVISPGSRNAPLSVSFEADSYFHSYSIIDERSAAFFAMGIAQQSRIPTVLVCTSGSAALNYAPAVAEAYYQHIPLLVITADRPPEWIDQGDGQTIRQREIFGAHVLYSAQLNTDSPDTDTSWHNSRLINEAVLASMSELSGPVHLNIPFKEPLYGITEEGLESPKLIQRAKTGKMLSPEELIFMKSVLDESPRVLAICGILPPDQEFQGILSQLASSRQLAVLTESTSNLSHPSFISSIDRLIMTFDAKEEQEFSPDLLITFGTQIISKKIKALLRKHKPRHHWHVGPESPTPDTFQSLTRIIPIQPRVFLTQISTLFVQERGEYAEKLLKRDEQNEVNHQKYLKKAAFSDFKAFSAILPHIPKGSNLQMGNSSVVRYVQLFRTNPDLSYNGNRGTSGIDGCTSAALGAAWERYAPTTLISGDVSFLYDSNALWMNYLSKFIRIIVINNGGGGIFRIIDGPSSTPYLEKHFESRHQHAIKDFAKQGHWRYRQASDEESLKESLKWLYRGRKPSILEIVTPYKVNDQVLKSYFRFLKENK